MNNKSKCGLCSESTSITTENKNSLVICGSCASIARKNHLRKSPPDQKILKAIKSYGSNGIAHEDMLITPPFSIFAKWQTLDFFLELLIIQQEIRAVNYLASSPHYFARGF